MTLSYFSFSYFQTPPCSMDVLRTSVHHHVTENWLNTRPCLHFQMCIIAQVLHFSDPVVAFWTLCCLVVKMGKKAFRQSYLFVRIVAFHYTFKHRWEASGKRKMRGKTISQNETSHGEHSRERPFHHTTHLLSHCSCQAAMRIFLDIRHL